MKKLYITFFSLLALLIGGGIFYVSAYNKTNTKVPTDIAMQDVNGKEVVLGKEPKKLRLVEFIYTNCPDVCPTTTLKMKALRDQLVQDGSFGKSIEFWTITIDPARDTQDVLKAYAKTFDMQKADGWYLLRGTEKDTKKFADAFSFLYRDPGDGRFIHTSNTYLLDENNRLLEVFGMGENGFNNERVLKKIKAAM
ncbi:SCO family protein [Ectobacillus ponti]|uniref:SCO family protein n=1 Tax=Ectobacillus ponti TaxID=2961894 RepID=A0AA42BNZ4_9BACI|nr:SCO family protein [Ectobacillus ponti]MCP8968232.1 SCO family protein [Ectobacillus ponti]